MSETNGTTVPDHPGRLAIPNLSKVTLDAVNAAAVRLQLVDNIGPDTVDIPDLLIALSRVAESRPDDGDDQLVISLVDLAALALLWSETADGLTALLNSAAGPSNEGQADRS